ncbi:hypothetical protein [Agrobacterium burrii]|uniref:Uncharacterized protein n=1 Tax=Agrobacterium burrii TaxID=2815339 RepID=A0ABS3EAY8_9HYPH|nr:hypothetical protein [Agrobacterium burrii]MBO0129129.1 hypothetical protein [Agrobacterium burrii]
MSEVLTAKRNIQITDCNTKLSAVRERLNGYNVRVDAGEKITPALIKDWLADEAEERGLINEWARLAA